MGKELFFFIYQDQRNRDAATVLKSMLTGLEYWFMNESEALGWVAKSEFLVRIK